MDQYDSKDLVTPQRPKDVRQNVSNQEVRISMLRESVRDDEPARDVRGILAKYGAAGG